MIIAQQTRRLETSSTTFLARIFDNTVYGISAVVPTLNNIVGKHLPLGNQYEVNGIIMRVKVCEPDHKWVIGYIQSGQFQKDLESLQKFVQANNINTEAIGFAPSIQPSITMRIKEGEFDPCKHSTIEHDVLVKTDSVPADAPDDKELPVEDSQTYAVSQPGLDPVHTDLDSFSKSIKSSKEISATTHAYHTQSLSSEIKTTAQAHSILFPIFAISKDPQAIDILSVHTNSKASYVLSDAAEEEAQVATATNIIFLDQIKAVSVNKEPNVGKVKEPTIEAKSAAVSPDPADPNQRYMPESKGNAAYDKSIQTRSYGDPSRQQHLEPNRPNKPSKRQIRDSRRSNRDVRSKAIIDLGHYYLIPKSTNSQYHGNFTP